MSGINFLAKYSIPHAMDLRGSHRESGFPQKTELSVQHLHKQITQIFLLQATKSERQKSKAFISISIF